jgi:hypothetical protein
MKDASDPLQIPDSLPQPIKDKLSDKIRMAGGSRMRSYSGRSAPFAQRYPPVYPPRYPQYPHSYQSYPPQYPPRHPPVFHSAPMYRSHTSMPSYMRPNNGHMSRQMPAPRPSVFRMTRRNLSRSRNRVSRPGSRNRMSRRMSRNRRN